jgi:hypothetical protein
LEFKEGRDGSIGDEGAEEDDDELLLLPVDVTKPEIKKTMRKERRAMAKTATIPTRVSW